MIGIPTKIVNVSDIGDGYSSDIYTYIKNYYTNQDLGYVLLVGDHAQVPTIDYGYFPSDPSYSYLTGNDHYPDIFIGRFSAQSIDHVHTQVNRTIHYERDPDTQGRWYEQGTGLASNEGAGNGDNGESDWLHMRRIRYDLLDYHYTMVDEFYDGSHGGQDASGDPSYTMVSNALNQGRGIINYCGHGSTYSWGTSGFDTSDINNLENDHMLPFICSVACYNGNFDYSTCFAEVWMRATNNDAPAGAIATFMSSHAQAWRPPMRGQDEIVDILVGSYANNRKITFGGLCISGCMEMNDDYGYAGYEETDYWHIFGDPSVQVRTRTPTNLTVAYPQMITQSTTTIPITVDAAYARCALSSGDRLLGVALTDDQGQVTLELDAIPDDVDALQLWVTAYNAVPFHGSIFIGETKRQPAEFDPMQAVLIRYPLGISYEIIREMAENITVITIVNSQNQQQYVTQQYSTYGVNISNCQFLIAPTDSYWIRDYGPWFVQEPEGDTKVVDFEYNRPRPDDNAIPAVFADAYSLEITELPLEHTGGNYMTDGQGIAVSTDLVLQENPGYSHDEIQGMVSALLGIDRYHIVPDALGEYIEHIDCWAKFLAPDTIMITQVPSWHSQYDELESAVAYFENQTSSYGTPYDIARVYAPYDQPYINSLILNDKVLVPVTGSNWDDEALTSYETAMPGYEIIGCTGSWDTTDALHCRVLGIPALDTIVIDHVPLDDSSPSPDGFEVKAHITPLGRSTIDDAMVTLHWKYGETSWMQEPMNPNDDEYAGYIPPQPDDQRISYYLSVETTDYTQYHPYMGAADPHTFTSLPDDDAILCGELSDISFGPLLPGKLYLLTCPADIPIGQQLTMHPGAQLYMVPLMPLRADGTLFIHGEHQQPCMLTSTTRRQTMNVHGTIYLKHQGYLSLGHH